MGCRAFPVDWEQFPEEDGTNPHLASFTRALFQGRTDDFERLAHALKAKGPLQARDIASLFVASSPHPIAKRR